MDIKGFIFDVDGTLVNSTRLHFIAWNTILSDLNIHLTAEKIYAEFSKTPLEVAQNYLKDSPKLDPYEVMVKKNRFFLEHIDQITIFPYVKEFLTLLHKIQIPFVLASNGSRKSIIKMTEVFEFLGYSKGIVAFEDVTHAKPHPEMILKSIEILGLNPQEIMMVGDSVYDILAAQAAGTKTTAIPFSEHNQDFSGVFPDFKLHSFSDLEKIYQNFLGNND